VESNHSYLIVGGGLAGLTLAYFLRKAGQDVTVVDDGAPGSSSRVAAGIVHPVTGRRKVKTWLADAIIPFARNHYREVEALAGRRLFHDRKILEVFASAGEVNDWTARSTDPAYAPYHDGMVPAGPAWHPVQAPLGGVQIRQGGYLEVSAYLDAVRDWLGTSFVEDRFGYDALSSHPVRWNGRTFSRTVCCDGVRSPMNPHFDSIPLAPVKGEILTIRCSGLTDDRIFNQGFFILPVGEGLFRVGATFAWDFADADPSNEGREAIEAFLRRFLAAGYTVEDHQAAVRPAIRGRRPVMGLHPGTPSVGLFNGLGTKGVSLAPYFAERLTRHLVHGDALMPETDVCRYL